MHWFWRATIAVFAALAWVGFDFRLAHRSPVPPLLEVVAVSVRYCLPPLILAFVIYGLLGLTWRKRIRRDSETRCRQCGYILRGITEPRCPECGERI